MSNACTHRDARHSAGLCTEPVTWTREVARCVSCRSGGWGVRTRAPRVVARLPDPLPSPPRGASVQRCGHWVGLRQGVGSRRRECSAVLTDEGLDAERICRGQLSLKVRGEREGNTGQIYRRGDSGCAEGTSDKLIRKKTEQCRRSEFWGIRDYT